MLRLLSSLALLLLLAGPAWADCEESPQVKTALTDMRLPERDHALLQTKLTEALRQMNSVDCVVYFALPWSISGEGVVFTYMGALTEVGYVNIGVVIAAVKGDNIDSIKEIRLNNGFVYVRGEDPV